MNKSGTALRAAVYLCSLASSTAFASNAGIQNYSGAGGMTCAGCHNVTGTPVYNIALVGPSLVAANSVNAYTFNETWVSGTKALGGGFDLETTAGTFTLGTGEKLWDANSELTHSPNQPAVAGNMSWPISWTAPAAGSATMTVCGLARYGKANPEVMACPSKTVTVNTAPVAADDALTVGKNSGSTLIDVLANDSNADSSDTHTLMSVTTPSNGGSAIIASGKVDYHPAAGYIGTETFTYTVQDSLGLSDTATVTVTVVNSVLIRLSSPADFVIGGGYDAGVTVADINRDGKPDIVASNSSSDSVTVFLNNTAPFAVTPAFLAGVNVTLGGSGPRSVAAGDFNKDGAVDLVTANRDTDDVSVLMNTTVAGSSTPTFSGTVFPTGTGPLFVLARDLDADGKVDIAVLHNGETVRVMLNDTVNLASAPSFTLQDDVATGASPFGFTIGNFLNNARNDMAIGNSGSALNVLVYRNQTVAGGMPSFTNGTNFDSGNFGIIRALASGDLNGDGKVDIVAVDEGHVTVGVLRNTAVAHAAAPSFAAKQDFALGANTDNPGSVLVQDLNGDGKPEIVAASGPYGPYLSVLTNATPAAATSFSMLSPLTFDINDDFAGAVASADFNGDKQPDLVTVGGFTAPNYASVLLNQTYCTLRLAAATASVTEGTASIAITVKRAGVGCPAGSVLVSTHNSTAAAGSDYTALSQTLNWALGDVADKIANVTITNDTLDEDNETFTVGLSASTADLIPTATPETVTIKDNDNPPTVFLDKTAQIVDEAPTGQFRVVYVMLSGASGKTVTVPYARAGSAAITTDYTVTQPSPVVFSPGQTQKAVRFDIVNDAAHEGEENVTLTLGAPTNATLGSPTAYELKIKASD
jgi:hypothetical protein